MNPYRDRDCSVCNRPIGSAPYLASFPAVFTGPDASDEPDVVIHGDCLDAYLAELKLKH